jgi:hypothetical protein
MIISDFFDHTHTPRHSHQEQIPDTLFNVGAVEMNVTRDDRWVLFNLEGLELMQISYDSDIIQSYPVLEKQKHFKSGETDRKVPGWSLSYPVFDRLLCLYAFYSKKTPLRLWLTRSPGFSYHVDSNQAACVKAPEINLFSLSVLFGDAEAVDSKVAGVIRRQGTDDDQEVVYDRSFHRDHFHPEPDQPPHVPPLNEQWWSLAHCDYKSTLSSTCGCN